jgi:hypothetical protein
VARRLNSNVSKAAACAEAYEQAGALRRLTIKIVVKNETM